MADARFDVVIVGGGPAGAGTAWQLARRGVGVAVLDRARFPRTKPCAECLSPQASRVLADMGCLDALESRGVWLRGMVVRSPDGTVARGDYVGAHGFRALRDGGLSIRRDVLDSALLDSARGAGAVVHEGTHVADVARDQRGRAGGVVLRDGRVIHARLVVGADGLRSIVARRLALARASRWPRRVSLVAHYREVAGVTDYGEMHVERDGFVGIADVGAGLTTVAAVFPTSRGREIARDRHRFLDEWLASRPQLRDRFRYAHRADGVVAVGPFASHARRATHPAGGALLVGDAADFFDPFTGEGIYAALRGGELASRAILAGLDAPDMRDALETYDADRRAEFGGKWLVERIIGSCVAWPRVVNRAARALSARKEMADLLVGVTGDFVPAREVLRLGYLARLFLLPIPSTPTLSAAPRPAQGT